MIGKRRQATNSARASGKLKRRALESRRRPHIDPALLDEWESSVSALLDALKSRPRKNSGLAPWDNRNGTIRRHVYKFVRHLIVRKETKIISQQISVYDCEPRSPSFRDNPFYWALLAISKEMTYLNSSEGLTSNELSRFAAQLKYAHQHDIDPNLLIGFIYQVGGDQYIARQLKAARRETWV